MKKFYLMLFTLISVNGFAQDPTSPAPTPSQASSGVISVYSGAYTDVSGTNFYPNWGQSTTFNEISVSGDSMIKYAALNYQGIEFTPAMNVSSKDTLHLDIFSHDVAVVDWFLINPGPFEQKVALMLDSGQWNSINIPLGDYTSQGVSLTNVFQFKLVDPNGSNGTIYVDNIYYHGTPAAVEPAMSAPTPTYPDTVVLSLFSGIYTDLPVNTWRTPWSNATLDTFFLPSDTMWKYSALDFVGIEAVGANSIDASGMEHFNLDIWTPDATLFRVKLVDWGADNAFGGGDDTEHEIVDSMPATNGWVNYHIDLDDFANLASREHISQIIFSAQPAGGATVFVDNIYFSKEVVIPTPMTAAPDPTHAESLVISLFSGVYTDVTVDTWRTGWSQGDLTEEQVAGNDVKKYTNLNFVGVETVGANSIDASGMQYFNFDMWTPNQTQFRVKLVDFGPDNAFQGGDDTEHELTYDMPATATWNSFKIDLDSFVNLTGKANISQLIFSGNPVGEGIVYIDNVYFSRDSTGNTVNSSIENVTIYPNPAHSLINVKATSSNVQINKVTLSTIQGQRVFEEDQNVRSVNTSINVAGFAKGVYIVQLHTSKGIYSQRVTVQ